VPELPEAQVLADQLRKRIVGKRIVDVYVRQPKALNLPVEEFGRKVRGRVKDVARRAKSVVLIEDDGSLWLHMGLRSEAGWKPVSEVPQTAFLSLVFDDGNAFYLDKTFMGRAYFLSEEESAARSNEFGVDPLGDEFTLDRLKEILRSKPNVAVKVLLMDQEQIAGIGNIYSDDILFVARIRPERKASSLSDDEIVCLHKAIRQVLSEAVERGAGPEWVDLEGRPGGYVPRVHGATNCPKCGGVVKKISIGGRTAYFCERCQR